jgi:hypothetical protein
MRIDHNKLAVSRAVVDLRHGGRRWWDHDLRAGTGVVPTIGLYLAD